MQPRAFSPQWGDALAQPAERGADLSPQDDGLLGLWPVVHFAGEDDAVSPAGRWDRMLDDFEIIINIGDAFTLELGDGRQVVSWGDVCVLRPRERHALLFEAGRHAHLLFCHHDWVAAPGLSAAERPDPWGWPAYIPCGAHSVRLGACLQEVLTALWVRRGPWRWEAAVALLGAAAVIERVCGRADSGPDTDPDEPPAVRVARAYMEDHLAQGCGALVREAARAGGLSAAHLNRLFHATYQRSPRQWICERRVARACFALVHRHADVAAAARAAGFSDVRYFSRFFQRHTGLTPSAYRARHVGRWRLADGGGLRQAATGASRLYPCNVHITGW